jgi:hypothetical protein
MRASRSFVGFESRDKWWALRKRTAETVDFETRDEMSSGFLLLQEEFA